MAEQVLEKGYYKASSAQNLPGFIYLLRRSDGLYKIGCTGNVDARLGNLRHHYKPLQIELLHAFPCGSMQLAEDDLHWRYAERRIAGEWFTLEPDEVAEILRVKSMYKGYEPPEPKPAPPKPTISAVPLPKVLVTLLDVVNGRGRYTFPYRLLCNKCNRTAQLTVYRNYHKEQYSSAPLMVEMECERCGESDTARLWPPRDGEAEDEPPAWTPDEYSQTDIEIE